MDLLLFKFYGHIIYGSCASFNGLSVKTECHGLLKIKRECVSEAIKLLNIIVTNKTVSASEAK